MADMKYFNPNATAGPSGPSTGANGKFGYIDYDQLGTGQWGTGQSFQGAGRQAMMGALKSTQSQANPQDYANLDALRSYYGSQLQDLPNSQDMGSFGQQARSGLQNLSGQVGATGGGSPGLASRSASSLATGSLAARNAAPGQAASIQSGMGGVMSTDLNERQFQADQGKRMSDTIYQLMALDRGRTMDLEGMDRARADEDKQMLAHFVASAMDAAGNYSSSQQSPDAKLGSQPMDNPRATEMGRSDYWDRQYNAQPSYSGMGDYGKSSNDYWNNQYNSPLGGGGY